MKEYILIDAISCIDADIIEKHLEMRAELNKKTKKRSMAVWTKWALAAACFCIITVSAFAVLPKIFDALGSNAGVNEPPDETPSTNSQHPFDPDSIIWNLAITSPEGEPEEMGALYQWNGITVEEQLYEALQSVDEEAYIAVQVTYIGDKFYIDFQQGKNTLNEMKAELNELVEAAEKLEKFKNEVESVALNDPTEAEMTALYEKCVAEYGKEYTDKYISNGEYLLSKAENELSKLKNTDIPQKEAAYTEAKRSADEYVLRMNYGVLRRAHILESHMINGKLVMLVTKEELAGLGEDIDFLDFANSADYIFTLAPQYLAEDLNAIIDLSNDGEGEESIDTNEETKFIYSKLGFSTTDETLNTNVAVIEEINALFDMYDELWFTVSYSEAISAEKLENMNYSSIEIPKEQDAVILTVKWSDIDIEALKELSKDRSVIRIYIAPPPGAETGFGKDKIYFGWPVEMGLFGEAPVNGSEDIIKNITKIINCKHPNGDDLFVRVAVGETWSETAKNKEYLLNLPNKINYYSAGIDSVFGGMCFSVKPTEINAEEFIEGIKEWSNDPKITRIDIFFVVPRFSEGEQVE